MTIQNIKKLRNLAGALACVWLAISCSEAQPPETTATPELPADPGTAIKVEVVEKDGKYQLYRGGKPYEIKGAGLNFEDLTEFAAHGGNSIRTWSTSANGKTALQLLDEAHELGVTVSLGLMVMPERWRFDYSNKTQVQEQYEKIKADVLKYKDHPALLSWFLGNELNHHATDWKVYDAVNELAKMINEIDPNHPTTTTLAALDKKAHKAVLERAPALDFISYQVYGELHVLPDFIKEMNYSGPFMVTEWGAVGYWEMGKTNWGAPIEMHSTAKALNYLNGYQNKLMAVKDQLVGNYVFLWGQKQERTPTWFGLFTEKGEKTEAVDVMHYIWNGEWPENRTPKLVNMLLDGKQADENVILEAGGTYTATVMAEDSDGDELTYYWEVKPESDSENTGGDYEEDIVSLDALIPDHYVQTISVNTPEKPGAYRLYVYIGDGKAHVAHANIPFHVED